MGSVRALVLKAGFHNEWKATSHALREHLNPVLCSFYAFRRHWPPRIPGIKTAAVLNGKSSRKRLCLYLSQIFLQFLTLS